MRKLSFLIIFYFGFFSVCHSQEYYVPGNPIIRNFLPEEYGAHAQNWNIVQDHRGIMYFANGNSILEYDGENWTSYELNDQATVLSLSIDIYGTLYVGGTGDFGYLAINENGLKEYISLKDKIPEEHKAFSNVWQINSTTNGVYFSTYNKIFHLYKNKIKVLEFKSYPFSFSAYDNVFVNDSAGMTVFKNNVPLLLPHTEELKTANGFCITLPFIKNKLLFISQKNGLYLYDYNLLCKNGVLRDSLNTIKIGSDILTKLNTECDEYLKKHSAYTSCIINDTSFALGTEGGIVILNNEGKLINIINKDHGLVDDMILHLYTDKQQNIWAATNNGISYIQLNSPFTLFDQKNGLESLISMTTKHKGRIYTATYNSCLFLPQYKLNQENERHHFKAIINKRSWSLETINDQLFVGTSGALYQIKDTVSKNIFDSKSTIYAMGASQKFPDHIFLGIKGLFTAVKLNYPDPTKINQEDAWVKLIENETMTFPELHYITREISSDKHGNLWISTEVNGIFYLKFLSDKLNDYRVFKFDTSNGLPSNISNRLYINDNKIFVATIKGIYEAIISDTVSDFNESSVKFVLSKELNVMSTDSIGVSMMKFDKNKIFISSAIGHGVLYKKNGVYKFNSITFKEIESGINDIYPDESGIVWYSTYKGIYRYNSNKEKDYKPVYNALIRKVTINSDSILFFGNYYNDSIIDEKKVNISSLSQIPKLCPVLSYQDNSIIFEYSAAFYEYADKLTYKYILEGFDKDTSDWTLETKKEYTNLPEGNYCFKVKAKNFFENESTIATYKFSILPPWYRSWWAYSIYIVLAILFIYIIAKLNSKRLKAANIRLENIIKERTLEISLQNEEIQTQAKKLHSVNEHLIEINTFKEGMTEMIVHDLKNPLNTILGLSEKVQVRHAGQQMLNMVLNILDVQKFENAEMKLQISRINLFVCANEAFKQVQLLLERKSIKFENTISSDIFINVDSEIIIRVFVNIFTNAIKFTPNNGKITLFVDENKDTEFIKIKISDTGQGIPKDKIYQVFNKFSQIEARKSGSVRSTGLGLSFCKLAVEAHGGTIGLESKEDIGTVFWFYLPISKTKSQEKHTGDKIIEIKSLHERYKLSASDIEYLTPFFKVLKEFTVYEFSDIISILDSIEVNDNNNIVFWKSDLENALRACNEKKYNELLN